MAARRNRRAGVEDLWTKDERQEDGTVRRVPSKLHGKGKRWRARYVDSAGKEHSKRFARKPDAQAWLDGQTAAVVTGRHAPPAAGRTTVGVVAQAWLASHPSWEKSTRSRNVSIVNRHIIPRWGSTRLADLMEMHDEISEWVTAQIENGASGGTVRKHLGVLSGICDHAVRTRKIAVNPCDTVDRPKQQLAKRRYLSGVEVELLAEHAGSNWLTVMVLAYCGLRFAELAGMQVSAVSLARNRFQIERTITEVDGELVIKAPKDHQRRSVPFPTFLVEPLRQRIAGRKADAEVFTSPQGAVLRARNMRRDWFDGAAKAAGVDGLTPHELRHTAASLAVSEGASVLAIQRMLGHDKPSTTLDVYADLFDDDLDAVASKLDAARTGFVAAYSLRTESGSAPISLRKTAG
ncbi:tyrosine-type recombinase/integrase [Nocardia flavorosea]|uniref:Site-specific integrase n=1 Tax=Nocardia flavorosea TaxID=53429 RepID=A0A846YJA0_9NOCA|nr:site-specific integrase [Nocardia flavorosea]NKY56973.1 site-specific integrase [Nocardia flavorosea]NKY56979.1 site-specific integrase [Nocardia flavorosea]